MDSLEYLRIFLTSFAMMIFFIISIRLCGLRSFSKMTGFDFVITVALGTLLASPIINPKTSLLQAIVSTGVLFLLQYLISLSRKKFNLFANAIDNDPKLLFENGEFIDKNLQDTRVTRSDIIAKMREANATDISKISAVVLEATGDISVLHGDKKVSSIMLDGVKK